MVDTLSPTDDAPQDVGADPAVIPTDANTAPAQKGKSYGKGLVIGAILGVAAAGLGYGAALQFPFAQASADQGAQIAALTARIAALESAPTDTTLQSRLTALESAQAPDISPLEARLTALEQRLAAQPVGDDLRAELADIRAKLAQSDPTPAIKAAIAAEMGTVQETAQQMVAQVAAAAKDAAALSAMTLLRAALDTGAPFAAAAQELDLPADLADYAQTGIPSLTTLKDSFPAAARAGLDAALRSDTAATWAQRVTNFLRSQTGARSLTPQTGNDPDAVLSRIEAALRAADITAVMAEVGALPPVATVAMADWIALAQTRANALRAFETLTEQGK